MKQIEIIVPHERLSKVNDILFKHKVGGMMFHEIKGRGRAEREAIIMIDHRNRALYGSRTRVDVMVSDSLSQQIVDEIIRYLSTGSASDGKIFVKDISEVYDIGSGLHGEMAL